MSKLLLAPSALTVAAALFAVSPAALAQTSPSQAAATIGAVKCSDLTGLSEDESHDLILYIAGYHVGMSQAPGAAASTSAPAATDATGAATSTTPADTAMAPATADTSTTGANSSSSKLAQMVGLGIEPQAIVTACGSTPDSAVLDVVTSNANKPATP
jgi:hypothetical protein